MPFTFFRGVGLSAFQLDSVQRNLSPLVTLSRSGEPVRTFIPLIHDGVISIRITLESSASLRAWPFSPPVLLVPSCRPPLTTRTEVRAPRIVFIWFPLASARAPSPSPHSRHQLAKDELFP